MEVANFEDNYSSNVFESRQFYYIIENPLYTSAALTIQKIWRGYQSRKISTKFIKKMKYRIHIITELVKSEETYISHLNLLLQNCYHPLKQQMKLASEGNPSIITQSQLESLFSNITSIYEFNSLFYAAMLEEFSALTHTSKFSQVMIKFADRFEVYYPYTANCEEANKTLEQLRKNNKKFNDFLEEIEFTEKLKNMELWSFLIKPVQRITKYPLLLADLLKHTPPDHPDYAGVEEALAVYKKINEENNLNIERYEKLMKMVEYQETYGARFNLLIYRPDRTILAETNVTSPQNPDIVLKMIVLTDLILIVNTNYEQKGNNDMYIELGSHSMVKDLPDTKYFSNLFSISGLNAVETFITESKEEKLRILSLIDNSIVEIHKKEIMDRLGVNPETLDEEKIQEIFREIEYKKIEVHIVGTEQHIRDGKPRTYYVVLISFCSTQFHKCFKRHSEFCQLSKSLAEAFPKKKLPRCEKKFTLLKKFRTKTVEMRKLVIENLLQLALQDSEVRDSKILQDFIKFPPGFFEKTREESKSPERMPAYQKALSAHFPPLTAEARGDKAKTISLKNVRSVEDAMQRYSAMSLPIVNVETHPGNFSGGHLSNENTGAQQSNEYINEEEKKQEHEFDLNPQAGKDPLKSKSKPNSRKVSKQFFDAENFKYNLVVHLVNGRSFEFKIDNRTNARFICKQISIQLNLIKDDDFRLFILEGSDQERPLDGDECITDVMRLEEEKDEKSPGFFRKVSKSVIGMFQQQLQQKLIFKKYYYLPKKHERKLYQADPMRLNLIVSQCLQEVKELRYDFDHSKFLTVMCLGAYNQHSDEILQLGPNEWFKYVKKKHFYEFLPEAILKTKPKEFWKSGVESFWPKILDQIDETIKNNKAFIEEKGANSLSDAMKADMINPVILVKNLILNLMWSHRCFGMNLYEARVYNPDEETLQQKWPTGKFILGVKYGEILALSMSKSKYYLSHKLSEIVDIKCYPVAIKLFFKDYEIRLDTKKSFEIHQLIVAYQKLEEALSTEEESPQKATKDN